MVYIPVRDRHRVSWNDPRMQQLLGSVSGRHKRVVYEENIKKMLQEIEAKDYLLKVPIVSELAVHALSSENAGISFYLALKEVLKDKLYNMIVESNILAENVTFSEEEVQDILRHHLALDFTFAPTPQLLYFRANVYSGSMAHQVTATKTVALNKDWWSGFEELASDVGQSLLKTINSTRFDVQVEVRVINSDDLEKNRHYYGSENSVSVLPTQDAADKTVEAIRKLGGEYETWYQASADAKVEQAESQAA